MMLRKWTLGLSLLWLAAVVSAAAGGDRAGAAFDQEKHLGAWVKMWNSYDLSMAARLFIRDSRLSYFSSEKEGIIRGFEAVQEHHRGFGFVEGGKVQGNKLWLERVSCDDFGTSVVVTALWYFIRSGESGTPQRGPVTFVYILENGEYRLAHLHFAGYRNPR